MINEFEFLPDETLEGWVIRQTDRLTKNWSDETWKILGITQDLIDLKEIRVGDKRR